MPKLNLESLRPGMVVTTDVKNMDDMLLIPAGGVITERHVDILGAWGVTEVQVQACDGVEDNRDILQRLPPDTLQKLEEELQRLYWEPVVQGSIQAEIYTLALRRKARQTFPQQA